MNIPPLPRYRLLFVCMGNICRSPAAEGVMRHLAADAGLDDSILCDSAGTIGFHQGHPPDERMTAAAAGRGITLDGQARQFTIADFAGFDLILTMDEENFRDVTSLAPDAGARHKVIPMVAFCSAKPTPRNVPDPYYGGPAGFARVLDILEDGCAGLLEQLKENLRA